jgi:hypothetical protein
MPPQLPHRHKELPQIGITLPRPHCGHDTTLEGNARTRATPISHNEPNCAPRMSAACAVT